MYQSTIDADPGKMGLVSRCLSRIRMKLNMIRIMILLSVVGLVAAIFYLPQTASRMLMLFLETLCVYMIILLIGTLILRTHIPVPVRYYVFVHEPCSKRVPISIIVIPEYMPRGREVFIIPVDMVSKIGIVESTISPCRDVKISGAEIFIQGADGREILRFGILGERRSVEKVAMDLWEIVSGRQPSGYAGDPSCRPSSSG